MQNREPMELFVVNMLKKNIPASYSYHNYEHSLYVHEKVTEIALQEKLDANAIRLLQTAALWHDTGYISKFEGHEEESCRLAKEYLPGYGFTEEDIKLVCGMIMATKIPQSPTTLLEKILADADLAYLGTHLAEQKANDLFKELCFLDPTLTKENWNQQQIDFLENHQYFTSYCAHKKEPIKQAYLALLKESFNDLGNISEQ